MSVYSEYIMVVLVALVASLATCHHSPQGEGGINAKVTLCESRIPLNQLGDRLHEQSGIKVSIDSSLKDVALTVFCRDTALRGLLDAASMALGIKWQYKNGELGITPDEEFLAHERKEQQKRLAFIGSRLNTIIKYGAWYSSLDAEGRIKADSSNLADPVDASLPKDIKDSVRSQQNILSAYIGLSKISNQNVASLFSGNTLVFCTRKGYGMPVIPSNYDLVNQSVNDDDNSVSFYVVKLDRWTADLHVWQLIGSLDNGELTPIRYSISLFSNAERELEIDRATEGLSRTLPISISKIPYKRSLARSPFVGGCYGLGDHLYSLWLTYGKPIICESFRFAATKGEVLGKTVGDVLSKVLGETIRTNGPLSFTTQISPEGWMCFRPQDALDLRMNDLPEQVISSYEERFVEKGKLALWDYASLASKLSTNALAKLQEGSTVLSRFPIYPLRSSGWLLQLLGSLDPRRREEATKAGCVISSDSYVQGKYLSSAIQQLSTRSITNLQLFFRAWNPTSLPQTQYLFTVSARSDPNLQLPKPKDFDFPTKDRDEEAIKGATLIMFGLASQSDGKLINSFSCPLGYITP